MWLASCCYQSFDKRAFDKRAFDKRDERRDEFYTYSVWDVWTICLLRTKILE
jgi:hypothetical protein